MINFFAAHLFGRHIRGGSHHSPRARDLFLRPDFRADIRTSRRLQFGQSEIENLHLPVSGDEQVLRFEIAMRDALLVGGCGNLRISWTNARSVQFASADMWLRIKGDAPRHCSCDT
jgi:hypothetical protein